MAQYYHILEEGQTGAVLCIKTLWGSLWSESSPEHQILFVFNQEDRIGVSYSKAYGLGMNSGATLFAKRDID